MSEWVWRLAEPLAAGAAPDLDSWPPLLRQLLYNRGLRTRVQIDEFLEPDKAPLNDPYLLKDMDLAVDRIYRALRAEELIAVYGDFDADGLTAVALLYDILKSPFLQGRVTWYLPHRTREGYGLNVEAIKSLSERGATLLITVDCGIGADDQIRYATTLGMDVIVTDHHLISAGVPPALAVLNARQDGCSYPFKELSGVGMAYKLSEALLSRLWDPAEARARLLPYLDVVALGAVADVAPLVGENRSLVAAGLRQIASGWRPGLKALLRSAGWQDRTIDTDCVSYVIAPRLNAAGRMGDASAALRLLLAETDEEAQQLAAVLEEANRSRQTATAVALTAARVEVSRGEIPQAIVIAGDYPAGILGLVAGKLAEEFLRPAFVVELGECESRGSGRGVPGFDVVQALASCSDLLVRFGGHSQAGGFSFHTENLDAIRSRLESSAAEQLGPGPLRRELLIEGTLQLNEVVASLHRYLVMLEPYGAGNSRPLFCSRNLRVRDSRTVGNGHLKLWLSDESGTCPAIGFGMANAARSFSEAGMMVDCAYSVSRSERGGSVGYELVLKDLVPSIAAPNVL